MEALNRAMIDRLKIMRNSHGLSDSQFRLALEVPFSVRTLKRALRGKPVTPRVYWILAARVLRHRRIHEPLDGKSLAAGERAEEVWIDRPPGRRCRSGR